MPSWSIDRPALDRTPLVRDQPLRDPDRLRAHWRDARVVILDDELRIPVNSTAFGARLVTRPAGDLGPEPPPDAVLVGQLSGRDYWAIANGAAPSGASLDSGCTTESLRSVGACLGDCDLAIASTALALLGWHSRAAHCARCGREMAPRWPGHSRSCAVGHEEFPRTDPAVIVAVHDGADRLVLARNNAWPPGRFSVLAGFVEAGESLEATVVREVREEVALEVSMIEYLGSQPWPFPRSVMVAFAAQAASGGALRPDPGEIAEVRWFSRDELRTLLAGPDAPHGDERAVTLPGELSIARRMIEAFVRGPK